MKDYHKSKRFDIHCDTCGEVTDNYDTFNEWQEYEGDTVSLNICKACQWQDEKEMIAREMQRDYQYRREQSMKEFMKNEEILKSLDRRKGIWYTIINKLKGRW